MNVRRRNPDPLRGVVLFALVAGALYTVAAWLDRPLYRLAGKLALNEETRLINMLYYVGFPPVWFLAAAAIFLIDTRHAKRHAFRGMAWRAFLLASTVVLSGLASEAAKFLVRRARPNFADGAYVFRDWSERTFSTSGLGMPSGHATTAFAAAWVLCFLFPRASVVWLVVAAACAMTRVLVRAHFVTDVVVGAVLSYAVARLMWRCRLAPRDLSPSRDLPFLYPPGRRS